MIQYKIRNNVTNQITNQWLSDFADQHYYEECFGKQERWVREGQEDISAALETRTVVDIPATQEELDERGNVVNEARAEVSHVEYKLASEYTVEVEDITAQMLAKQESDEAMMYLTSTDWYILREVDSGIVCPQEIKNLRAAARLKVV